jgi:hypothetical protein
VEGSNNDYQILENGVGGGDGRCVVLSLGATAPVSAAETIKMTAIDGYSTKSMWVREFAGFLILEIDRRLAAKGNYKIEWN